MWSPEPSVRKSSRSKIPATARVIATDNTWPGFVVDSGFVIGPEAEAAMGGSKYDCALEPCQNGTLNGGLYTVHHHGEIRHVAQVGPKRPSSPRCFFTSHLVICAAST